jgi:hypothetical protein
MEYVRKAVLVSPKHSAVVMHIINISNRTLYQILPQTINLPPYKVQIVQEFKNKVMVLPTIFGYLNDNQKASKLAEMVTFLIYIHEEPSLNFFQDTDYPDSVFPRFC